MSSRRVGVIFGGRSGEHEVSLASAASVMGALERSGHAVVPIGIARDGRWVVGGDALGALAAEARVALPTGDPTGSVKKALADRAESQGASSTALVRHEPAGGLPPELRHGLDAVVIMLHGPYGEDGTVQGLLELADVPYVDSAGLGEIVRTYTTVSKKGGKLKLLNLTAKIRDLLAITKLLTVFETYDSEADAVKSF